MAIENYPSKRHPRLARVVDLFQEVTSIPVTPIRVEHGEDSMVIRRYIGSGIRLTVRSRKDDKPPSVSMPLSLKTAFIVEGNWTSVEKSLQNNGERTANDSLPRVKVIGKDGTTQFI